MSTFMPVYVPPKTRQWAISAVVLAVIYMALNVPSLVNYQKSVAMLGSKATIAYVLSILDQIVAIAFLAGGIGVLKVRSWGRETLTYAAAGAIVLTVLSSIWSEIIFHDPQYMTRLTSATPGGLPSNFAATMLGIMTWAVIGMGLIQIIYCVCMYRHMSAEPVEPQTVGYASGVSDQGVWPPPPAS